MNNSSCPEQVLPFYRLSTLAEHLEYIDLVGFNLLFLAFSSAQSFLEEVQVESSEDEQVVSPVRASKPAGPTALACRIPQTAPPVGSGPLAHLGWHPRRYY
jgi:hypothetical protein